MTILGNTPDVQGPRPKHAERILAAELLDELRSLNQSTTERAAKLQGQAINGVLDVCTDQFDATNVITRAYHAAIGAVAVTNLTAATITVVAGQPGPAAPTKGQGVTLIPAGASVTVPIGQRAFSIWGTTGSVSWRAYTGLQPFGVSNW